jgi:CRP/FNR family transcriptional regulator
MAFPAIFPVDCEARVLSSSGPTLNSLFAPCISEHCHPRRIIFWEGDCAADVFKITGGIVRLYRLLSDGRRAITGFAFPGDVLGLAFHDQYLYTAEAVTDVRLGRMSRKRLHHIAVKTPSLHSEIFQLIARELSSAQKQMVLLGQKNAEERVASFLLEGGQRVSSTKTGPIIFDLPITRLDMADYLGLTIETVCRALTKLKQANLVSLKGRHRITLHDPVELAQFAARDDMDTYMESCKSRTAWLPPVIFVSRNTKSHFNAT